VKGAKQLGRRSGNWLSLEQCSAILTGIAGGDLRATRDHAMISTLVGCGLRRSELVTLELEQVQTRQGHWAIIDLVGKGGHIRTVPMPQWVKDALDGWTSAAGIVKGRVFRAISRSGRVWGSSITENVVWHVVSKRCTKAGWNISRPMTCAGRARGCATAPGESWSRFNSCSGILRCRRRNDTWVANRTSAAPSTTGLLQPPSPPPLPDDPLQPQAATCQCDARSRIIASFSSLSPFSSSSLRRPVLIRRAKTNGSTEYR